MATKWPIRFYIDTRDIEAFDKFVRSISDVPDEIKDVWNELICAIPTEEAESW